MNNKTQKFYDVLKILEKYKLTNKLILVGGWCLELYKEHFEDDSFPMMQTQDIDILIKNPFPKIKADIDQILTENGFLRDHSPNGHTHYINESLEIEFLTPTKGAGTDKPIEVKRLNVTAQALKFMNIIQAHVETFYYYGIQLTAPNPCVFALIKLLVSNRRSGSFHVKAEKDRKAALGILNYLKESHPEVLVDIRKIKDDISKKLQKEILVIIQKEDEELFNTIKNYLID